MITCSILFLLVDHNTIVSSNIIVRSMFINYCSVSLICSDLFGFISFSTSFPLFSFYTSLLLSSSRSQCSLLCLTLTISLTHHVTTPLRRMYLRERVKALVMFSGVVKHLLNRPNTANILARVEDTMS